MMNEEKVISIAIWNCKVMSKKSVTGPKNCLFQKNLTVYKLIKYLTVFSQDMFIYIALDMSPFKCAYSSAQSCPTLCNPMNHSTPGLPVHHQLPEFTQTHVHWVGDAIQPSHPLLSPSSSAPNPSQHQSFPMSQLFSWGGQSTGVSALASVFPKNTQDWSPSEWTGWISLQSKGLSIVFSNTTLQKHQFFSAQPSSQSNSHIHTWTLEKL